jgi:hypothetical protein
MNLYSKSKRGRWEKDFDIESKTKNPEQTFNHPVNGVLNFELCFSMKGGIIYVYVYTCIQHIHACICISLRAKINNDVFQLKMLLDGELSFEMQSKIQDFKVVSDSQHSN